MTNLGNPSLLYAVTNRKDYVLYRLDNELQPQPQLYTNRKTVDQKRKKVEKPEGCSFEVNPEPDLKIGRAHV